MIRLIIAVIGLFIIWVLFFSILPKERKILLVALSLILSVFGIWYESDAGKPQAGFVKAAQIVSCGVSAEHSYRSNFDISLCLENTAEQGHVKRIELAIIAAPCNGLNQCSELQRVVRGLQVDLLPASSTTLSQNLSFDKIGNEQANVKWAFEVLSVKASK